MQTRKGRRSPQSHACLNLPESHTRQSPSPSGNHPAPITKFNRPNFSNSPANRRYRPMFARGASAPPPRSIGQPSPRQDSQPT